MLIPNNRRIPDASTRRVYQGDYMASTPLTSGSKKLLTLHGVNEADANGYTQFQIKQPNVVFEGRTSVRMDSIHEVIALYFERLRILDDPFTTGHAPLSSRLRDGSRIVNRARCGNAEFCGPILWSMGKPLANAVRLSDNETVVLIKTHSSSKGVADHRRHLTNMVDAHTRFVSEKRLDHPFTRTLSVWHSGTIRNLYNANQVVGLADHVKRYAERVIDRANSLAKARTEHNDRQYYSNEVATYLERMHTAHRLLDQAMEMREALQSSFQTTDVYPLPPSIVDKINLAYALANAGTHPMLAREHEEETRVKLLNAIAVHALES